MHGPPLRRMEMPLLKRPDWWLPAIVICVWVIDVLDGNTFLETLTGPVIVALWAGAIYLIDRWVVRIPDQNGTGPSI
jgi:hypothetical protein